MTHVLAAGLAGCGCSVDLLTPERPHAPLVRAIAATGGAAFQLTVPSTEYSPWETECFYRSAWLHERFRAGDIDVVHAMSHDTAIAAAIALAERAPGARPVLIGMFSEIGTEEEEFGRSRATFAYRLPEIAMHAALSRRYAEMAVGHGVPLSRVRLTYGGVDLARARSGSRREARRALGLGENEFLFACPSRFSFRKGQLDLLEAFERASAERQGLRLVLAGTAHSGSDDFLREVERDVAGRGLEATVRIVEDAGYSRLPEVLAAADAVVQPSHFEGLGFSALEAMAAEKPVVLTRVPGFVEFARDAENALVTSSRAPAELAEALLQVAADADLRRQLIAGGSRTAEEFSAERFVTRVLSLYDECLNNTPGA